MAAFLQLWASGYKAVQNAMAAASTLEPVWTRGKDLARLELGLISAGEGNTLFCTCCRGLNSVARWLPRHALALRSRA